MSKTSILMTGASGLVGSRFIEMFHDKYEISNIDLTNGVDILSPDSIEKFVRAHPSDCLIHLAAFTDTQKAGEQAGDKSGMCYRVNVEGTQNIAAVCRSHSMYMIHVSTDFVFDGTKQSAYTEQDQRNPLEWYGQTKMMAEDIVAQRGVLYSIARISYPYRAHCEIKPDIIMKLRLGMDTGTLNPQFTDTTITPTFIDDIARAFDALCNSKKQGTFHLTGSTSLSPFQLACKVADVYGYDKQIVKEGTLTSYLASHSRPYARHVAVDNTKATHELSIHFATIDEGLSEITKQQKGT